MVGFVSLVQREQQAGVGCGAPETGEGDAGRGRALQLRSAVPGGR